MARRPDPAPAHEIDLHGLTVERARRRLVGELTRCRALRMSPVLVITGHGFGSSGGSSRLAPAIRDWLAGPEARAVGVRSARQAKARGAILVELGRSDD